jgi:hypothetical protein
VAKKKMKDNIAPGHGMDPVEFANKMKAAGSPAEAVTLAIEALRSVGLGEGATAFADKMKVFA